MKKKIGFIAMIIYLCLVVLLQIIYQAEIRMRIPYDWWDINRVHYPREIADHLADCFFGVHYFLFGYLLFERKHYYGRIRQQEEKKVRLWVGLAIFCQIGALCLYAVLWLAYTDVPKLPVNTPFVFVYNFLRKSISDMQMSRIESDYKYYANWGIILAPVALYLVIYIFNFLFHYFLYKKRKCLSKKWRNWNFIYIVCFILILFWVFDAQTLYSTLESIPILRGLRRYLMPW